MHIKVLGTGCESSRATASVIEEALRRRHLEIPIERVDDNFHIGLHAVKATPAVLIDGVVVHEGGVPSAERVEAWLDEASRHARAGMAGCACN